MHEEWRASYWKACNGLLLEPLPRVLDCLFPRGAASFELRHVTLGPRQCEAIGIALRSFFCGEPSAVASRSGGVGSSFHHSPYRGIGGGGTGDGATSATSSYHHLHHHGAGYGFPTLLTFTLSHASAGEIGVKTILRPVLWDAPRRVPENIVTLNLSGNGIRDASWIASVVAAMPTLQHLLLEWNELGKTEPPPALSSSSSGAYHGVPDDDATFHLKRRGDDMAQRPVPSQQPEQGGGGGGERSPSSGAGALPTHPSLALYAATAGFLSMSPKQAKFESFGRALKDAPLLETIDLRSNHFTADFVPTLALIVTNPSLKHLDVSWNHLCVEPNMFSSIAPHSTSLSSSSSSSSFSPTGKENEGKYKSAASMFPRCTMMLPTPTFRVKEIREMFASAAATAAPVPATAGTAAAAAQRSPPGKRSSSSSRSGSGGSDATLQPPPPKQQQNPQQEKPKVLSAYEQRMGNSYVGGSPSSPRPCMKFGPTVGRSFASEAEAAELHAMAFVHAIGQGASLISVVVSGNGFPARIVAAIDERLARKARTEHQRQQSLQLVKQAEGENDRLRLRVSELQAQVEVLSVAYRKEQWEGDQWRKTAEEVMARQQQPPPLQSQYHHDVASSAYGHGRAPIEMSRAALEPQPQHQQEGRRARQGSSSNSPPSSLMAPHSRGLTSASAANAVGQPLRPSFVLEDRPQDRNAAATADAKGVPAMRVRMNSETSTVFSPSGGMGHVGISSRTFTDMVSASSFGEEAAAGSVVATRSASGGNIIESTSRTEGDDGDVPQASGSGEDISGGDARTSSSGGNGGGIAARMTSSSSSSSSSSSPARVDTRHRIDDGNADAEVSRDALQETLPAVGVGAPPPLPAAAGYATDSDFDDDGDDDE